MARVRVGLVAVWRWFGLERTFYILEECWDNEILEIASTVVCRVIASLWKRYLADLHDWNTQLIKLADRGPKSDLIYSAISSPLDHDCTCSGTRHFHDFLSIHQQSIGSEHWASCSYIDILFSFQPQGLLCPRLLFFFFTSSAACKYRTDWISESQTPQDFAFVCEKHIK